MATRQKQKAGPVVFTTHGQSPNLTVTTESGQVQFRNGVAQVADQDVADELREWAEGNPGAQVEEGGDVPEEGRIETERGQRATVAESVVLPGGAESGVSPAADMTPAEDENAKGEPLEDAPIKTFEGARGPQENVGPMSSEQATQGGEQSAGTGKTGKHSNK